MTTAAVKIRFRDAQIDMAHGAGGKASRRLVEGLIAPILMNGFERAEPLGDAAHVTLGDARVAITTDSFVVKPLRFPGGSIGELAINGTVNDLAVSGARAETIVVSLILEAGLATDVLEAEIRAMADAARKAGVRIAGGDTKVVEHGFADKMYITTAGIGRPIEGLSISPRSVRPGDKILLSGPIGDHGITILLARGELDLEADLKSDTRSVLPLVEALVNAAIAHAGADAKEITTSATTTRAGADATAITASAINMTREDATAASITTSAATSPDIRLTRAGADATAITTSAIKWMRDPTRGGAATSLNELARDCGLGILLAEDKIPVRDEVRGACELLGLDPLHIANEGQFLAVLAPEFADAALAALHRTPGGEGAVLIGDVSAEPAGTVIVTTLYGGSRVIDMLVGDPLPRIC